MPAAEPERSEGNPVKESNPIFCLTKNIGKKKKQRRAKKFAKQLLVFCRDYEQNAVKKAKKWHLQWDSTRRAMPAAEPERSEGNPVKESNPIFCLTKNIGKKKKQQRANKFAKQLLAFCRDYELNAVKKAKKWHLQWDSNPCCRDENPVS